MSLEDVKKQLKAISKSVETGRLEIAIASLCAVIQAFILEIERIDKKPFVVPRPITPYNPIEPIEKIEPTRPWKRFPDDSPVVPPIRQPDKNAPRRNAGDAE